MSTKSIVSSIAVLLALTGGQAFAQSLPDGLAAKAAKSGSVRVIVQFDEPATAAALDSDLSGAAVAKHTKALRTIQTSILSSTLGDGALAEGGPQGVRLMDISPMFAATVTPAELAKLAADKRVKAIEEDGLSAPTLIQSTGIIKMTGAAGAWAKGAKGTNQIVAILDTGVNKNHEFLKGKVISEACFNTKSTTDGSTSRCPGGATSSFAANSGLDCGSNITGCGHGTHVAGIAAGHNTSPTAGEPTNGVALTAKIIAINIFSRFNKNSGYCDGIKDCVLSYTSDQIAALERVYTLRTNFGVRKIAASNMSLGGGSSSGFCNSDSRNAVIVKLRNAGIATVIAAGNDGQTNAVSFPGCISSATTVAASSKTTSGNPEEISSYSNMGTPVDIVAPGGDFGYPASLGNASLIYSSHFGSYAYLAGTSMAAPHVTGAFAAIRSKAGCSTKTVAQIEAAMKATGLSIHDSRGGGTFTRKRIDVAATVASLCP